MELLRKDGLAALLVRFWPEVLDSNRLMALVLRFVRGLEADDRRTPAEAGDRGPRLSVSRFDPTGAGFLVWVEFSVPRGDGTVSGTAEVFIDEDGRGEVADVRTH